MKKIGIDINLLKLRKKYQYSQEELARKIGVSAALIGYIEQGLKTPSLNTAIHIANTLNVTLDELACVDV